MKRVLITGGAGFIGSNLSEYFVAKGYDVICMDNLSTGNKDNIRHLLGKKNFKFAEGDVSDYDACLKSVDGVDIVLHQAALGSVPRSIANPIATNAANVTGFLNILWASVKQNVPRFVFASSSSVYGDIQESPKHESRTGKLLSPYSITKHVDELYALQFAQLYNIDVVGLRYFNVFGKHQEPNGAYAAAIPRFLKALIGGESPVVFGDGEQSRDFTYIKNVIQANELAGITDNKSALNKVYNIAYGEATTLNELIEQLKESLARHDPSISNIRTVYQEPRKGDIKHSLASIDDARTFLGYSPEFSIESGLNEAIEWYWNYFQKTSVVK